MLRRLAIAALLFAPSSMPLDASEGWTVSCSQDGRVLHVEKLDGVDAGRERQLQQRYPGATCIFISDNSAPLQSDQVLPAGASADSLEAALLAITGGKLPSAELTPVDASTPPASNLGLSTRDSGLPTTGEITELETAPRTRPTSESWVRLAIYKTDDVTEAIEDWDRIAAIEPTFRFVTPAVTTADDGYVMLSAGPIPAGDRAEFCLAASSVGMDCVAGRSPAPSFSEANYGLRYVVAQFPSVISSPTVATSIRPTFPRPADYWDTGGKWSLICYPGLHVEPEFLPYIPQVELFPPLPRPRPHRG